MYIYFSSSHNCHDNTTSGDLGELFNMDSSRIDEMGGAGTMILWVHQYSLVKGVGVGGRGD